jgi:hypothetical protein
LGEDSQMSEKREGTKRGYVNPVLFFFEEITG